MDQFRLPQLWGDDDAMYSLMQPIKRPREVDPDAYDRKVNFWRSLIESYAKCNRVVIVSLGTLKEVLSRDFPSERITLQPECLPYVLSNLLDSEKLHPVRSDSLLLRTLGSTYSLMKVPASWAWSWISGSNQQSTNQIKAPEIPLDQSLVFVQLADELCTSFIHSFLDSGQPLTPECDVYLWDDFQSSLITFFLHEPTRKYIACQLISSNRVQFKSVNTADSNSSIKIVYVLCDKTMRSKPPLDDAVLAGLAHLSMATRELQTEQMRLESEVIPKLMDQIKKLVAAKRKTDAMHLLRRKKHVVAELSRIDNQLHNLEDMQLQISKSKTTKSVIKALAEAAVVLKNTTGGEQGIINVEDTMDEVVESCEAVTKICGLLDISVTAETVNKAELEDELQDLLNDTGPASTAPSSASKSIADAEFEKQLAALDLLTLDGLPDPGLPSADQLNKIFGGHSKSTI